MTTATQIINLALEASGKLGMGQIPAPEDDDRGLRILNMMLGQWGAQRWLVYHLVDTSFTSTAAASYTVAAAGNFAIPRPDRLEAAYARLNPSDPNPVDYPLVMLESREDWSRISLKSLSTFPSYVFYDSAYATGNVFFWPIPSTSFELHIVTKAVLTAFATLATEITLPLQYEEALWTNLAIRFCTIFQIDATEDLKKLAAGSLNTVREANTQIPRLQLPAELVRPTLYNIYSDQSY